MFFCMQSPFIFCADEEEKDTDVVIRTPTPEGEILSLDGKNVQSFVDGDYRIVILHGSVHISMSDTQVWADSAVLWYDYTGSNRLFNILKSDKYEYGYLTRDPGGWPESAGPGAPSEDQEKAPAKGEKPSEEKSDSPWAREPMELYAEGNVKILYEGSTFLCDQVYTNLAEKRGVLLSGQIFGERDILDRKHPLHFKAEALKQVCGRLHTMENATFSTCVHSIPHYELRIEHSELKGDPKEGIMSLNGTSIAIRGAEIPLFDTSFQVGRHWYFPVKRLKVGTSSRYGPHAIITLGENFDKLGKKAHSALGIDNGFRGDIELELGLLDKRGIGLGPALEYESEGLYKGYLKGYFINDSADSDRGGAPIEENKRGRIRTQNRVELGDGHLLDLELSYITDRHFLDEYYESEFKTDKEQETYAYFHKAQDHQSYSLLGRFRLNDFDSQNEYIPQARWDLSALPVPVGGINPIVHSMPGVFYSHGTEFSQVRYRPDDELAQDGDRLTRGDYNGLVEAPFKAGIMKITPFYENRMSYFERTLDDSQPAARLAESFGVRSGLLFHALSDFKSGLLNIDGIRNIVEPALVYRDTFAINKEAGKLIPFDEMETPVRGDALALEVRQRIQTRDPEEAGMVHTMYDGLFRLPFFPDRRLGEDDHRMGNLGFDLWFRPLFSGRLLKKLTLNEEGEFDLTRKGLDALNSRLHINPDDDYTLILRHRWIRSRHSYFGTAFRYLLTPKWEVELGVQYDIVKRTWVDRSLIFRRRAHQWLFEIECEIDRGDNNKSVSLNITPLALFSDKHKGSIFDPLKGE